MLTYGYEFWIQPNDDIYPIGISKGDLCDWGTIYFRGNDNDVFYIMAGLKDAFLADGYNCLAISDYIEATLYNIYYINNMTNSMRRQQLEFAFQPDVELVYSKDTSFIEVEDSMTIIIEKAGDKFNLVITVGEKREEIYLYEDVDFKILLDRIVSLV